MHCRRLTSKRWERNVNVKFYACVAAVLFAGYAIFSGPSAPPQVVVARAAPPAALPPIVLAPYEDNSKLDFGPSNPGTTDSHILDVPQAGGNTDGRSVEQIIAGNNLARSEYGVRIAERNYTNHLNDRVDDARRATPFTGMSHY
jgi:hypothetical protein